jgi:hypothetical protein
MLDSKRREFIALLGGGGLLLAAKVKRARGQQPGIPRFIYVPNAFPDDPEARARHATFRKEFEKLGWADGHNIRIEEHWGYTPPGRLQAVAAEFVRLAPNVIMTSGSGMSEALQRESQTIPVVFVAFTDPLSSGLVASMARPGGNLTGFANYVASIAGKWLEMLKEVAPRKQPRAGHTGISGNNHYCGRSKRQRLRSTCRRSRRLSTARRRSSVPSAHLHKSRTAACSPYRGTRACKMAI